MKRILLIALVVLFALVSQPYAQTTTNTIQWDYLNATPTQVATYTQTVTVNGTVQTTAPTCVASGVNTQCQLAVTLISGSNTINVSATLNGVTRGITLAGLNPATSGPKEPTNFRYNINVTINVP